MKFSADTHVHVYPCHAAGRLLTHAARRMAAAAPGHERLLMLAERRDCHFFNDLRAGAAGARIKPWVVVEAGAGDNSILLGHADGKHRLWLVAGHQAVTLERLEVLALGLLRPPAEGRPAADTIRAVADAGGLPVLAWAPGKWLFGRGKIVRDLIDAFAPGRLLLGDTSLRPRCWPEPVLMRRGRRKGLAVVAGSDPLPCPGEERMAGSYAICGEVAPPAAGSLPRAVLDAMRLQRGAFPTTGARGGAGEAWKRWSLHRKASRCPP